jgi:hypothetical protein
MLSNVLNLCYLRKQFSIMNQVIKHIALVSLSTFMLCTAAQAAQWKTFADTETGLVLIKSGLSGEKINLSTEKMVQSSSQNLSLLKGPMTSLQKTLAPLVLKYETGIGDSLKSYRLENSPKYEQLDSKMSLAQKANEILMKAYFINSAVETQTVLLPVLEGKLKAGKLSIEDKAAAALVSLSLGNFLAQSSKYAQQIPTDSNVLVKEVSAEIDRVQKKISANPMSAFQMGQELQFLMEAQSALGKATEMTQKNAQLLPTQAQKLASLMQNIQKLF